MTMEEAKDVTQTQDRQSGLERFRRDAAYFWAHREQLLREYPDHWVAIYRQEVVGADPDFDRVLDMVEAKGIGPGEVFIEHLTTKDEVLILRA